MTRRPSFARACGCCFIVPPSVLRELGRNEELDPELRARFQATFAETQRLRIMRDGVRRALSQDRSSTREARRSAAARVDAEQFVFDCRNRRSLPGRPTNPASSGDPAVTSVFGATAKVAQFYVEVFGRNSIDNEGIDLVSSVRYLRNYDNAFWNGQQMVYGEGDGEIFIDFWRSADVIGHELTHGVTQYESGLLYEGEPGALNESLSDVFGAVFNQWLNEWRPDEARGWLIGAGIMGPRAAAAGKTCLRDMVNPSGTHSLSPQPESYRDFDPTGDVHLNSGIPNKAFSEFAQSLGEYAWERAARVWYAASTGGRLSSNATFSDFATKTMEAAREQDDGGELQRKLSAAWNAVDIPL
jgi:Zn-dependent metalloprotease